MCHANDLLQKAGLATTERVALPEDVQVGNIQGRSAWPSFRGATPAARAIQVTLKWTMKNAQPDELVTGGCSVVMQLQMLSHSPKDLLSQSRRVSVQDELITGGFSMVKQLQMLSHEFFQRLQSGKMIHF
eukprot:1153187-Pelagomonas_calceolata.AAC.2